MFPKVIDLGIIRVYKFPTIFFISIVLGQQEIHINHKCNPYWPWKSQYSDTSSASSSPALCSTWHRLPPKGSSYVGVNAAMTYLLWPQAFASQGCFLCQGSSKQFKYIQTHFMALKALRPAKPALNLNHGYAIRYKTLWDVIILLVNISTSMISLSSHLS